LIFIAIFVLLLLSALRAFGGNEFVANFGTAYGLSILHTIGVSAFVAASIVVDQFVRFLYWEHFLKRRRKQPTPALIRDILTVALVIVGLSIGLSVEEGFTFTGLIAASGATAVVLGSALQAVIQDLFSGLSIHFDGSYVLSDLLTVYTDQMDAPQYGRVTGISWRTTFLELEDGRTLLVPNHVMTANPVLNHTRPARAKRGFVMVEIDYRVAPERVVDMLLGEVFKMARAKGLSRQPEPEVIVTKYTSSSIFYELRFYFWPEQISPSTAQSVVLTAVIDVLQNNDIPTPVTQVELTQPPDVEFILGDEEKRGALARAPLFSHVLDDKQLDELSRSCVLVELPRGKVLMRQGDPPSNMYVVLEGAVSITIAGDGGVEHEVAVSATGDIVGEMSLMTGANRNATATAIARLRALEIRKPDIEALLRENPGLAERFAQTLARRQQELDETLHRATRKESQAPDILARMKSFFAHAFT
jgi:small-conductance mechanosensitive channel/CRP-like cAMP-binding protein